jgi:hypothetical protein
MSSLIHRPAVVARRRRSLRRRLGRFVLMGIGWVLLGIGAVGTVLPGHLGLPLLILGLIIVLRASAQARRQFVGLQRRHPRIMFPIRRLLRRNPQVVLVAWQQALRVERFLLPKAWRSARRLRRWARRRRPI